MAKSPRILARLYRFRLRTLIIVISMLAIWLGLLTYRAETQRKAVEVIERAGGKVSEYSRGFTVKFAPKWIQELAGEHYFFTAKSVQFSSVQSNSIFPELIDWTPSPISRETIRAISRLPHISSLTFDHNPVRFNDIAELTELTSLKVLQLSFAPDSSFRDTSQLLRLSQFIELRTLIISELPKVSGQLSFLRNLSKLKHLTIESAQLGQEDLKHIGTLSKLESLTLGGIAIDGATLASLKSLEVLLLRDELELSDEIFEALVSLKHLKGLGLPYSSGSEERIEELQHALPSCNISTQ